MEQAFILLRLRNPWLNRCVRFITHYGGSGQKFQLTHRMFAEFRMKCALSRDSEAEIRIVFFKKCSDRFRDLLKTARESSTRPSWIIDDLWVKLLEYWNSLEFKMKNEQGKASRLSNKDGSVHTGGSISVAARRGRLENVKRRPVT